MVDKTAKSSPVEGLQSRVEGDGGVQDLGSA